jgi:hypothetical protein
VISHKEQKYTSPTLQEDFLSLFRLTCDHAKRSKIHNPFDFRMIAPIFFLPSHRPVMSCKHENTP